MVGCWYLYKCFGIVLLMSTHNTCFHGEKEGRTFRLISLCNILSPPLFLLYSENLVHWPINH